MHTSNNILSFINNAQGKILANVAQRVKVRRLEAEQTQKELAQRAGIPLPTYRRFERTGEIAFRNLLMLGVALDLTDEFDRLFACRKFFK